MASLLRTVAALIGVFILVPFLFLAWHFVAVIRGRGPSTSTVSTWLLIAVLIAFVVLGVFAMHRLWHLKQSGRWAAVGLFVVVFGLLAASALSGAPTSSFGLVTSAAAVVLLLLPPGR